MTYTIIVSAEYAWHPASYLEDYALRWIFLCGIDWAKIRETDPHGPVFDARNYFGQNDHK